MEKNNLFMYATSELSQDAFICWLLNFAHKDHIQEDLALTECAKEILSKIIKTGEDLTVTNILRQYRNIDVLLQVNGVYNIIVEDKTFSGQHGDQINRYKKTLEDEGRQNIVCVFYKIVEQAYDENTEVSFNRLDLIEVFSKYADRTQNSIFKDYYEYLLYIDIDVNAYMNTPIEVWRRDYNHVYKGFFTHLVKDEIVKTFEDDIIKDEYGWGYIPNSAGGFWGLWWYYLKCTLNEDCIEELYLQIEDNLISVKIISSKELAQNVRWKLYHYFKSQVSDFQKKAFRSGKHMTVGFIKYNEKNYQEKIEKMQDIMQSIGSGDFCFKD